MASAGSAKQKSMRDKQRASFMKSVGEERTSQRCPVCYRIITRDSYKSRYQHTCVRRED